MEVPVQAEAMGEIPVSVNERTAFMAKSSGPVLQDLPLKEQCGQRYLFCICIFLNVCVSFHYQ